MQSIARSYMRNHGRAGMTRSMVAQCLYEAACMLICAMQKYRINFLDVTYGTFYYQVWLPCTYGTTCMDTWSP